MMNAQALSCSDSAPDAFDMKITAISTSPSIPDGECCFLVEVTYDPPSPSKGTIPQPPKTLFISSHGGINQVTSTSSPFSTTVCYANNLSISSSFRNISCGLLNTGGGEACFDGCTVTIEPKCQVIMN